MAVERIDISDTQDKLQAVLHKMRYDFAIQYITVNSNVLEIGTGSGEMTVMLRAKCAKYKGIDYDADAVSVAVAKTQGAAEIVQGDAKDLPFADGEFSHIVCLEVLEHLGDWLAGVSEIRRCLGPGGVAIVSVPYRRIGGRSKTNEYHLYEPGETELVKAFKSRFKKVEVFSQFFEESALEHLSRVLRIRRFLGTSGTYQELSEGHPKATSRLQIDRNPRGLRLGVLLVASCPC